MERRPVVGSVAGVGAVLILAGVALAAATQSGAAATGPRAPLPVVPPGLIMPLGHAAGTARPHGRPAAAHAGAAAGDPRDPRPGAARPHAAAPADAGRGGAAGTDGAGRRRLPERGRQRQPGDRRPRRAVRAAGEPASFAGPRRADAAAARAARGARGGSAGGARSKVAGRLPPAPRHRTATAARKARPDARPPAQRARRWARTYST